MPDNEPQISYPLKEVLGRIEDKIDGLLTALAGKADISSVAHAHDRIDTQDSRLSDLENWRMQTETAKAGKIQWRDFIVPTVIGIISTIALLLSVFHP